MGLNRVLQRVIQAGAELSLFPNFPIGDCIDEDLWHYYH